MYGIIPRAIKDFFEYRDYQMAAKGSIFDVRMNYFEIYLDSLSDLLSPNFEKLKICNNTALNANPIPVNS